MPVFEYEIDFGDVSTAAPPANPSGASHVGSWNLTPVTPALDANRLELQNQELLYVTTLARTGNPSATGTPIWPQFKPDMDEDKKPDGDDAKSLVLSLSAGGDTEQKLVSQIRRVHNCDFWDDVTPKP
jgi:hypothetical protein